jgi:hypothetical protein
MAYNGWTNYETWNVNLWIDNDEGTYREKIDFIRRLGEVRGEHVREFFEHMGSDTPDFATMRENGEPVDLDAINFAEIAEHWEAERLDMQANS